MRTALDRIHHALQRRLGIGAGGRLVQGARHGGCEHHGPVVARGRELAGLTDQRVERRQLLWRLVHAHQWHQRAALPGFKPGPLRGGGIVGQFNGSKHEQEPLGFRLHACRLK
ncbi:hypothetical protein D3C72_1977720 [compost metagenome]